MAALESVHFFGIRHHGPGCARSLVQALDDLQPDCILVEGPQEGEALLSWVGHAALKPPVSLLVYAQDDPQLASFYPLTVFSPEWQAFLWANQHQVPVQLFDLPHTHKLALNKQATEAAEALQAALEADTELETLETEVIVLAEPVAQETTIDEKDELVAEDTENEDALHTDPLDALAHAAGYADGETWWNRLVEERQDSQALFAAINEAMSAVREHIPDLHPNGQRQHLEHLREAWMRQRLRAAIKQGFERIAVVCGAWHVPALQDKQHTAKADTALLKGLAKLKIEATWAPWSYAHLASASGYAAGVASPGWYEHLWQHNQKSVSPTERTVGWLSKVAHLTRSEGLDCSAAHIIETTRLAEMLATMRGLSSPGLDEINEAIVTVIHMGETLPLQMIEEHLNIGSVLGEVPADMPMVPLQNDIQKQQQSLRLKPEAAHKTLALDLRKDLDLKRSHFLHRLVLLGIAWAQLTDNEQRNRGTFRESWFLAWQPEMNIDIIAANAYGNYLLQAAHNKVMSDIKRPETTLPQMAHSLDASLLANMPKLVASLTQALQQQAATTSDISQLLQTVPPLAQVFRYGNVRQTDTALLADIIDGLVERILIGLNVACMNLDDSSAQEMRQLLLGVHQALYLRQNNDLTESWQRVLHSMMVSQVTAPLLRGLSCRLLLDAQVCDEATVTAQLSRNLSAAVPAIEASAWLQGFLNQQALVLLHHEWILHAIDAWVCQLSEEHFIQVLPLVRRNFADFSHNERQSLAQQIQNPATITVATQASTNTEHDVSVLGLLEPMFLQLFALPAQK